MKPVGPSNINIKFGEKWWAWAVGVSCGLILMTAMLIGATPSNYDNLHRIGRAGDPVSFNAFEVYTFKENGHRCFVVVKYDGNIEMDCP